MEKGLELFMSIADSLSPFCLNTCMEYPMFQFHCYVGNFAYHVTLCWHTFYVMLGFSQCEAQSIKMYF